jgi:DNA-binding transcriptional LysR family regulator
MAAKLNEIAVFIEVARKRSFVRAAEQLGASVSAVSRSVGALETRLGVRLLQRTTRSVGLTEAGGAYFGRCESLLAELESAEAEASALGEELRGRLRISAATGFGMVQLVPALPEFLAQHPRLTVDLDLSNRYVDLVEERFDVAIRVGELRDSRLVARRLGPNRRILAAGPGYLKTRGMPDQPHELVEHACLILDIGDHPERWDLRRRSGTTTVEVAGPLRSNNALALHDACRRGAGIALLPEFVLAEDIGVGRVQRVLPAWSTQEQGIYAIYPGHRFIPAKVNAFVNYFAQRLRTQGTSARSGHSPIARRRPIYR